MTKAIEELQGLLKQSSERYGALEDNFEKEKAEQKEELVRRNEAIRELKTELQNANDLIKTMKKKGNMSRTIGYNIMKCHLDRSVAVS